MTMTELRELVTAVMEIERERADKLANRLDKSTDPSMPLQVLYAEANTKWWAYHVVLMAIDGATDLIKMAAKRK